MIGSSCRTLSSPTPRQTMEFLRDHRGESGRASIAC
jgi:hypothetical protein